jgi:hypothetical protein
MPNWCNNTVEIRHEDPAMLERVRKGFNEGKLLNEFMPVPEDLQIVAGRVGGNEDPEQKALVEAENRNLEKYGAKNWYDWCVQNWGTKWDVGADGYEAQDIPGGLTLTFESAWAPPLDAFATMVEKFGFSIRAYYDEPGMAFCGIWEDGVDDFYEYGGMSSEQVAEELPEALDEMFGISESIAAYEEENQEIDLDGGLSATGE